MLDVQPEGRASTARLLCVGVECAEGGKLFERSIDAFVQFLTHLGFYG